MKLKLLILTILLSSCGGGGGGETPSSSTSTPTTCSTDPLLIGTWNHESINASLVFNNTCKVYSDFCTSNITFEERDLTLGQIQTFQINVDQTNGAENCPPAGQNSCSFLVQDENGTRELLFNCGSGTLRYIKE
jgi:hypothetical protein